MPLITAVRRDTGEITRIPESWLSDPERGGPYARYVADSGPVPDSTTESSSIPSERESAPGPVADEPAGASAKPKGGK